MISDEHIIKRAQLMGKMIVEGDILIDIKNGKLHFKTKGKEGGQSCDFKTALENGMVGSCELLAKFVGQLTSTESFKSYSEEEQDAVLLLVAHLLATDDNYITEETESEEED